MRHSCHTRLPKRAQEALLSIRAFKYLGSSSGTSASTSGGRHGTVPRHGLSGCDEGLGRFKITDDDIAGLNRAGRPAVSGKLGEGAAALPMTN